MSSAGRRAELDGRVVLVTGGSSGIGLATARRLARRGARVVVTARDTPRLKAAQADLGQTVDSVIADLTSAADRERLIPEVIAGHGRLDALVNNAAVGRVGRLTDLDAGGVAEVVTTNLLALADLTRLALPHLRRSGGDLVMVSSAAAFVPVPPLSLYSATKSGVHGLVTALRREERELRIHEILPGFVATPWLAYAIGWRPTDAQPHADPTFGCDPDRVALEIERCLTATGSRTASVPRSTGFARLTTFPPGAQLTDLLLPRIASRLIAWAREYGARLAHGEDR